jgi:hypothetical protein
MADDRIIDGSAVVTLRDQYRGVYWSSRRAVQYCTAVLILVWIGSVVLDLTLPSDDKVFILYRPTVFIPLLFLLWFALIAFGFRRLSPAQKDLVYQFVPERILVRDATGTETSIAWSVVRRVIEGPDGFVIKFRPAGARWIPTRAFAADRIAPLRALLRQMLGDKGVKLRG